MLTRSGWWAVASAVALVVASLVLGYPLLLGLGLGLAAALAMGAALVVWRPRVSAFQTLSPAVVGVGERADTVVQLTNHGTRRIDNLQASNRVAGEEVVVALPSLGPGESGSVSSELPTDQRGVLTVGPLRIELTDPFGFVSLTTHQGSTVQLTVHPQVHRMAPLPTGHRRELEGVLSSRPQEGGISFHSIRPYVAGDDLRLIHWRSVAKNPEGELLVRKNVLTSEPRLMVVLDTSAEPYAGHAFEEAVEVAASLVVAGAEGRYPVLFRTTGGEGVDITPDGRGRQATMSLLAALQPRDDDPGLNGVVRFAERVEGVSLGAVTGQPRLESTRGITQARPQFDMVTVAQVGESFDRPPMRIPGALVINGANALEVAGRWNARFGRQ